MINNYKILYAVGKSKTKFVSVLEFVLILLLTENIVKKIVYITFNVTVGGGGGAAAAAGFGFLLCTFSFDNFHT